jgi:hypothetical protein
MFNGNEPDPPPVITATRPSTLNKFCAEIDVVAMLTILQIRKNENINSDSVNYIESSHFTTLNDID